MEKNKVSKPVVIINCICAVVWDLQLVLDLVYGYTNKLSFILHIFCAAVWTACAVLWLVRWQKEKKSDA